MTDSHPASARFVLQGRPQFFTYKNRHGHEIRGQLFKPDGWKKEDKRPLLIVGGPRFDETMADELGVDRIFARGTTPGEVASFITHRLASRSA